LHSKGNEPLLVARRQGLGDTELITGC
jgi:hypothetical protein